MSERSDFTLKDKRSVLIENLESASIGSAMGSAAGAVLVGTTSGSILLPIAGAGIGGLVGAAVGYAQHERAKRRLTKAEE